MNELIVVPSRRAGARLVDEALAADGAGARAAFVDDVVTLRELVERASGETGRARLGPVTRALLAADVVDRLEPGVKELFGPGIGGPGAARAIGAAIAELRMAGLSALEVAEAAAGRRRLRALACALDAWERRLEADGLADEATMHRAAIARSRSGEWPATRPERLEVLGLYDVTPLQGELLLAIARRSASVRVRPPFDPADERRGRYCFPYVQMWESVTDPGLDIDIDYLWRDGDPAVSIEPAADPGDEARSVADWIAASIEAGCPAEEIAVVTAGGGGRPARLGRELERRGIAWHARRATGLDRTPLMTAALLPFRLLEEGWRRDDLLAWITSPLTAGLDPKALRPAIAGGPAGRTRSSRWRAPLKGVPGESRARLLGALRTLEAIGREERTAESFWTDYQRVLADVGLGPATAGWETWEQVLADLRNALEALGRWDGPPRSWRVHRRDLRAALDDRRVGAGRPGRGVSILTPYDARGLAFRRQAVTGLVPDSLVPPRAARSVFGDRDRRALNEAFGETLFRLSREDVQEGALLLADRIRSTAGAIRLSWPLTDSDGSPLLPAVELEEERRALGITVERSPEARTAPAWRLQVDPARIEEARVIELARADFFARDAEERRGAGGRYDGAFEPAAAATLVREVDGGALAGWSAGRLDTWRECPHRFFQRYVLRLEPPEASPVEAESTAVGRLAHRALQIFHGEPDRDRIERAIDEADEALTRERDLDPGERGDPAVWRIQKRRVAAVLARYLRHVEERAGDEPWIPVAAEVSFGLAEADAPAVPIETAHGTAALRGRIDRVDENPATGSLRVVDYKYSKATARHREAAVDAACGVDRFQLWAYFLGVSAWARAQGRQTPPALTGAIHCVREPRALDPVGAPPADEIAAAIAAAVEAAVGGRYDPSPRDPDVCAYCNYRRTCRIATVSLPGSAGDHEDER